MSPNNILSIIDLIQNSGSSLTELQLYALLPEKIEKTNFYQELALLENSGEIIRSGNMIFRKSHRDNTDKKGISRTLYNTHKRYLKIFSYLPWMRFIGLTGSNAFESCHEKDDIDLFVISAAHRLWIVYVMIVILSKLLKKRPLFCFNYLIDENSISFEQHSYHNAVQIYMMKPLFNGHYKKQIYKNNPWIKNYLPNIAYSYDVDSFYRLSSDFKPRRTFLKIFARINDYIFDKYYKRLSGKYPHSIGKGILLEKGVAKLHQNDKSHVYDELMKY